MNIKIFIGVIIFLTCIMIAIFQEKKIMWTSAASLLIIFISTIIPNSIFPLPEDILALEGLIHIYTYAFIHSFFEVINWNAVLICIGTMILSFILDYSKVVSHIGSSLAKRSSTFCGAIVSILIVSSLVSAFLGNVAAVIIMVPVAFSFCKGANIKSGKFVCAVAMMCNIEVAATYASSPESVMFAGYSGFRFNDFFIYDGRVSFFVICQVAMIFGCAFFYFLYIKNRNTKTDITVEVLISWIPSIIFCVMIIGLSFMSYFHHRVKYATGIFVFIMGIISLAWFKITQKKTIVEVINFVLNSDRWKIILFFIGTYILAAAVREVGIMSDIVSFVLNIVGDKKGIIFVILMLISVLISAFVDNVLYIAILLPFASSYALRIGAEPELFTFSLLLGSCIGSSITPIGSYSNMIVFDMLKKQEEKFLFIDWLKIGIPFAIISASISGLFLWGAWN